MYVMSEYTIKNITTYLIDHMFVNHILLFTVLE